MELDNSAVPLVFFLLVLALDDQAGVPAGLGDSRKMTAVQSLSRKSFL